MSWGSMPIYKVFIVNQDGKVLRSQAVRAESDSAAIAILRRVARGRTAELWRDGNVIRRFEPEFA